MVDFVVPQYYLISKFLTQEKPCPSEEKKTNLSQIIFGTPSNILKQIIYEFKWSPSTYAIAKMKSYARADVLRHLLSFLPSSHGTGWISFPLKDRN